MGYWTSGLLGTAPLRLSLPIGLEPLGPRGSSVRYYGQWYKPFPQDSQNSILGSLIHFFTHSNPVRKAKVKETDELKDTQ